MKHKVIENIEKFNTGRIPGLLKLKYKNMRKDVFIFYRGTAHLFYEHLPKYKFLYDCPQVWICGDLHFENFGSYKGDNGLVYFDINDFDEAALAPCLFDLSRFLVSLRLIAELSGMKADEINALCQFYIDVYCQTLLTGNSRWVEKKTAKGLVKELLKRADKRRPIAKLYSEKKSGGWELDFQQDNVIKPDKEDKKNISKLIAQWNKNYDAKSVYHVMDIGYHLKGTGSLGIERYVLVVQKKSNHKLKLVDLKLATPSCVLKALSIKQPVWENDAERTIEIQKRVQGTYQALLRSINIHNNSYVLREYQSCEDKINYCLLKGNVKKFRKVVGTMAQVTAWGQLQSGGRQGAAITDELIAFALNQKQWQNNLFQFTKAMEKTVKDDYQLFCKAYDEGEFKK